jgi:DNA processing protein
VIPERTLACVALREHAQIDPRLFSVLIMTLGPPEEILRAGRAKLASVPLLTRAQIEQIEACQQQMPKVAERLDDLAAEGVTVVTVFASDYPSDLRRLVDPPPYLYLRGDLPPGDKWMYVIGDVEPSSEGITEAVEVGKYLAGAGLHIVTGLGRGIEAAAHVGALAEGAAGFAFCASGLDAIEPPEQELLARQIVASGGIGSEYAAAQPETPGHARACRRLLAATAAALVAIEVSADESVTKPILDLAAREGKPVFYLPRQHKAASAMLSSAGAYPIGDRAGLDVILDYV